MVGRTNHGPCGARPARLRPAFGSGEDWNGEYGVVARSASWVLRPAFGSGEDWNERLLSTDAPILMVAPGLRVGRGLEQRGGVAIGRAERHAVAPGLRVGRGLELDGDQGGQDDGEVAPGLRVGRGLERLKRARGIVSPWLRPAFGSGEDWNILILSHLAPHCGVAPGLRVGRGLEREAVVLVVVGDLGCARPSGRARIGTPAAPRRGGRGAVAPGLRVGRGLEQIWRVVGRQSPKGCARPSGRARIGTRVAQRLNV